MSMMRRIFYTFILKNCSLILFLTARVASADHAPHGFKDLRLCEYPPRTGGKLPVGEDNCLTAYHNGGILHRVLQSIRLLCLMGKTFSVRYSRDISFCRRLLLSGYALIAAKRMTVLQKPLKVYMICSLYASVQAIENSPFLPHREHIYIYLTIIIQKQ